MKIEILYNCIPHGQRKNQNDVKIELNTRPTYLQYENQKDLLHWLLRSVKYAIYYDGNFIFPSLHTKNTDECCCHLRRFLR